MVRSTLDEHSAELRRPRFLLVGAVLLLLKLQLADAHAVPYQQFMTTQYAVHGVIIVLGGHQVT